MKKKIKTIQPRTQSGYANFKRMYPHQYPDNSLESSPSDLFENPIYWGDLYQIDFSFDELSDKSQLESFDPFYGGISQQNKERHMQRRKTAAKKKAVLAARKQREKEACLRQYRRENKKRHRYMS